MGHEEASSEGNTSPVLKQKATPKEIAEIVGAWTASAEGQATIMKGQEEAWKAVLELREARRIKDRNDLKRPRSPYRRVVFPG